MIKLEKGEEIVLKARKHWFVLFAETLFLVFLLVVPIALFVALQTFDIPQVIDYGKNNFSQAYIFLFFAVTLAWILFVWVSFFVIWTDYYLDILILTNKRAIDIEQRGLFARDVSTLRLERIQDITVRVYGLIPTFLNFGDIHIQTAGQKREFIIKSVANPNKIKNIIQKYQYPEN